MSTMTYSVLGPSRSSMPMTFERSSGFGTHSPCLLRHGHPASDLHAVPYSSKASNLHLIIQLMEQGALDCSR